MTYLRKHALLLSSLLLNVLLTFILVNRVQEPVIQTVNTEQIALSSPTSSPQVIGESSENPEYLVTRIIDGDTIEIEGGQKVRYIGIDTPELSKKDCFARESTEKNKELVLNKKVRFVKDVSETDRYGRLLRYVYANDIFVNNTMVREGFANASSYPPDVKFQEQFTNAEREAREQQKGLWGGC